MWRRSDMAYKKLKLELIEVSGLMPALIAMRLPRSSTNDTDFNQLPIQIGKYDLDLARRLVAAGDSHGKYARGIHAYIKMEAQVGWLLHFMEYGIGVNSLSSSSTMAGLRKRFRGDPVGLANAKQMELSSLVYTRIVCISFQTLNRIYRQRRRHSHPDWKIFCDFVETVPYFREIYLR